MTLQMTTLGREFIFQHEKVQNILKGLTHIYPLELLEGIKHTELLHGNDDEKEVKKWSKGLEKYLNGNAEQGSSWKVNIEKDENSSIFSPKVSLLKQNNSKKYISII